MLDVGDGHQIYWETCGNPAGRPAVFLHGGPGGGCSAGHRRFFDPDIYRAVLFDQRGCGRSRPLVSEPYADLRTNTTAHLIEDMEALRGHLGITQWTVLGTSWGTTLGLAYAQAFPDRVAGLVLGLVTTATRREVDWMTYGMRRFYPQEWERFAAAAPSSLAELPLVDAYATWLAHPDPHEQQRAADEWNSWDHAQSGVKPAKKYDDPAVRRQFARLVTHYWRNAAFLEDGQLLRDAVRLNGIPGALIAGAHDLSCPPDIPWELSRRWTDATLELIDAGHGRSTTDPDVFPRTVIAALSRLEIR